MKSSNCIKLHTQSIKCKKNESWPCPFFKLWINHIHLKEVWVCKILPHYVVMNDSGKKTSRYQPEIANCLEKWPVLYSAVYKLCWWWGAQNHLYGILKKETVSEFALCITKFPKGLEEKELAFPPPPPFYLFLCFSLWAICKWTSLNWFNQSLGICNSMLSAMRDSKRL